MSEATPSYADAATEPIDLAQAFKKLNENDNEGTAETVGAGEPAEEPATGEAAAGDAGTGEVEYDDDDSLGGSSDGIDPIDINSARQQALSDIQREAIASVRRELAENNIDTYSINDLYRRDEDGRVTFLNPDDSRTPFSSRAEAQQWVDAFNKQVNQEYRSRVNKKQQELIVEYAPKLRLIEFIPRFQSMSETEKDIFNELVDPYAVNDSSGEVIGFSVDLNAVANQAVALAKKFGKVADAEPSKEKPDKSQPAVDMPTGNGESDSDFTPKNIGEALKHFDKINKRGNKK